ncbi:MAG: peptidoglycan-binding protein [Saprospiraceae bacterium]|nr:peptidoglycan-binding protein [Saprospiraceae bacterium]
MARTLKLGDVDNGAKPKDSQAFFAPFHSTMNPVLQKKNMFRDEANSAWRGFREHPGSEVRDLQNFLNSAGFLRRPDAPGVFGYATHAGLRLFQEYVRTVEKDATIGIPDGVAGPKVQEHINRWKQNNLKCKWSEYTTEAPSPEYVLWFSALEKVKQHFISTSSPVLEEIQKFSKPSDTLKISQWDFDPKHIHLIGIRRNHDLRADVRANDDLFILLISGMVFKFWGSTDPNPKMALAEGNRTDEAYLTEGQHLYRFGWHKISDEKKIYRALRPATVGVLVFRDRTGANALTEANVKAGVSGPNATINIHWSGIGSSNFSAGCQVIAGDSYINHANEVVSCRGFAARSYDELAAGKTRGAYNVISDLVLAYAPAGVNLVRYTLGRDAHLNLDASLGKDFGAKTLEKMRRV